MTPPFFASIVEGQGDEEALPKLIYNIAIAIGSGVYPIALRPYRIPRDILLNTPHALEDYAASAIADAGPTDRLVILLDADDDCPAELGPQLWRRVAGIVPRERVSVCIANREYETWFIASLETIAEPAGINPTTPAPPNVESIRGAKEWLSRRLPSGYPYKPTLHQAALSSAVDVPLARQRSQSFDRFCREVERLLAG